MVKTGPSHSGSAKWKVYSVGNISGGMLMGRRRWLELQATQRTKSSKKRWARHTCWSHGNQQDPDVPGNLVWDGDWILESARYSLCAQHQGELHASDAEAVQATDGRKRVPRRTVPGTEGDDRSNGSDRRTGQRKVSGFGFAAWQVCQKAMTLLCPTCVQTTVRRYPSFKSLFWVGRWEEVGMSSNLVGKPIKSLGGCSASGSSQVQAEDTTEVHWMRQSRAP